MMPKPYPETYKKKRSTDYTDYTDFFIFFIICVNLCNLWTYFHRRSEEWTCNRGGAVIMTGDKIDISVVIPVYKNEPFIDQLVSRLKVTLDTITRDFEIIFVNDGSPDHSWELIKKNAANDHRVIGIRFARNFGQHTAITAGVDYCSGHWLVVKPAPVCNR